jgi:hypothetical protein
LLGTVVDEVIAALYEQRWLLSPDQVVDRLNAEAVYQMQRLYPQYSVAESQETLLAELRPLWPSVPETVRGEALTAQSIYVRQDFAKEYPAALLVGQPDLVFEGPPASIGGAVIVDVKLRARSSLDSVQLQVYRLLVQHILRIPVMRMGYWLPRSASVVWVQIRSPKSLDAQIDADLAQMATGAVQHPTPSGRCRMCPVRLACPEGTAYIQGKCGSTQAVTGAAYRGRPEIVGF